MQKISDRKGKGIRIWMIENDLTVGDIRQAARTKAGSVSNFIEARYTSKRLQDYFISLGCPAEYFKNGKVAA